MLLLLALGAAACATAATLRLPEGPWAPDPLAAEAFESASAPCRSVRTLTAEIAVRGQAGPARIRGRVIAGFERGGALRLEAPAPFGAPVFILVARANRAMLWLPRDRRVLGSARRGCARSHYGPAPLERRPARARLRLPLSDITPAGPGQRNPGGWMVVDLAGGIRAFLARDGRPGGLRPAATTPHRRRGVVRLLCRLFLGVPGYRQRSGRTRPAAALRRGADAPGFPLETNVPIDARAFDVVIPAMRSL